MGLLPQDILAESHISIYPRLLGSECANAGTCYIKKKTLKVVNILQSQRE